MIYCQMPIGQLFPIQLILLENGEVMFVRVRESKPIIDMVEEIFAIFYEDGFEIKGESFEYSTPYTYKELPSMIEWLQHQNLQQPA